MRKFALSALACVFAVSLTLAGEVLFVKFDKDAKKLTVKDGDKEMTYTITDDTKFKQGKAGEEKDVAFEKAAGRLEKAKEGSKLDITVDGKKLTEVKFKGGKKQ